MIARFSIVLCLFIAGCATNSPTPPKPQTAGPLAAIFGPTPARTGAQLWADNCTRCHYVRPSDYYSSPQWALVMQHMRSRADLTGVEERKILDFLQAGSGTD